MKITLVNPNQMNPFEDLVVENRAGFLGEVAPSLNLSCLAASVSSQGHDVEIIDHLSTYLKTGKPEINLMEQAEQAFPDSDVIGVSILTPTRKVSLDMVRLAKEVSKAKIIAGGPHVTFMPKQLIENYPMIDVAVIGEAETTFPKLVRALEIGGDLKSVEGIAFRKRGGVYFTKPREPIRSLDELPFPGREKYFELDPSQEIKTASIMTSRGCPYKCRFCSKSWGDSLRNRSVNNVIEEMRYLARRDMKTIRFEDDTLTFNLKRAKEIFEEIARQDFAFSLHMISRFGKLDEEVIKRYREAGGKSIDAAIETGSQRLRRAMNKRLTNAEIYRGVELLKKHGVNVYLYVMLGYPSETCEDLEATLRMLEKIQPDGLTCSIFNMQPASPIYEELKRKEIISDVVFLDEDTIRIPFFQGEELRIRKEYQEKIIRKFGITGRIDYEHMESREDGGSYSDLL